jgi:RNA polymerase sigma factor (sigma-70 family)
MSLDAASRREWARIRTGAHRARYLEAEEERTLLLRAAAGDRCACSELVDSHMRLVVDIAQAYARSGVPAQDLVSEGTVGLLEAISRYDFAVNTRLSTYAWWWVRARVRAYSLANRRLVGFPSTRAARVALSKLSRTTRTLTRELARPPTRSELAEALGVPCAELEAVVLALNGRDVPVDGDEDDAVCGQPADGQADPEQALVEREQRASFALALSKTLPALSERHRKVLALSFGDGEQTLVDVSRVLGVSRQRAAQMAAEIRTRLRKNLPALAC